MLCYLNWVLSSSLVVHCLYVRVWCVYFSIINFYIVNRIVTIVFINTKQRSESVTGFKRYTTNVGARQLKINNRLSNAIPKTNNYPQLQQSRQCTLVIVNNVCSHKCYTRTCVFYINSSQVQTHFALLTIIKFINNLDRSNCLHVKVFLVNTTLPLFYNQLQRFTYVYTLFLFCS